MILSGGLEAFGFQTSFLYKAVFCPSNHFIRETVICVGIGNSASFA